jgi:hypothetical protein
MPAAGWPRLPEGKPGPGLRTLDSVVGQIGSGLENARRCLNLITDEILRLNRLISELNQIAVRQCRFIAISSMIEAQRVECEADGDLTTVAHDINTMANRIGRIENDARDRILTLMATVRTLNQRMN